MTRGHTARQENPFVFVGLNSDSILSFLRRLAVIIFIHWGTMVYVRPFSAQYNEILYSILRLPFTTLVAR